MYLSITHNMKEKYSPLYFLSALGAGGLAVSFFVYLVVWVPHKGRAIPVFEDLINVLSSGSLPMKAMVFAAMLGLAFFLALHLRLMVWNFSELAKFKATPAYKTLRGGNAESQLLVVPLALAMSVNVLFAAGAAFVPGLWSVVEYLFPMAIVAFTMIGVYAMMLLMDFFGRVFTKGGFDCSKNNNLGQMMPTFAMGMVGVGLAAPVAMSQTAVTVGIAFMLSTFFITTSIVLGVIKMILGFRGMMEHGTNKETLPTLWVIIPILTLITIATMRVDHGLHAHFDLHVANAETFTMLTRLVSVQVFFAILGAVVMVKEKYFQHYVTGDGVSPLSYALVCPGVALGILGHFFINKGLVGVGMVDKFSVTYWVLSGALVGLHIVTMWLVFKLNSKMLVPTKPANMSLAT